LFFYTIVGLYTELFVRPLTQSEGISRMFITYCSTILREDVKVGVKEVDFQKHVTAKFFIA
jgi:hypothetical protein